MTSERASAVPHPGRVVISVDAMGGDQGPAAVVTGLQLSARRNPEIAFLLHGDQAVLEPLVRRQRGLAERCTIVHAAGAVTMTDKPSHVLRNGQDTSMWSALESVRRGEGYDW